MTLPARALAAPPTPAHGPARLLLAREPESPWAARALDEDVPPATLGDARSRRDELRVLLGRERAAAADFLLALADFDRRRGWERLGHASLFAFLTRELGLSKGAAFLRLSAARLLPRHPAVERALRRGDLCLSAAGELARVLTPGNEADVLPRYFGRSAREAREVSAALLPVATPPVRAVVTRLPAEVVLPPVAPDLAAPRATGHADEHSLPGDERTFAQSQAGGEAGTAPGAVKSVRAHEPPSTHPSRGEPRTSAVEPLTADLRRLHLTVSKDFLEKVSAAKTGLSHALPGATTEQVLEAALDLLLARQAQRKGLGRRARQAAAARPPFTPLPIPAPGEQAGTDPAAATSSTPPAPGRLHIPAAIGREVRLRDGDRCQFPLDAGGVCGSTWRVELDHVVPLALGGASTPANLRCACWFHNQAAAEEALGPAIVQAGRSCRGRKARQ